jgi:arsenate reductase
MEKYILFVCVGNACRSQIAEAYFNKFSKKIKAKSAGMNPAHQIFGPAVEVMKEEDIDMSLNKPKKLVADMVENAVKIIAMGDELKKSEFLAVKLAENWGIPDPMRVNPEELVKVRDKIKEKVLALIKQIDSKK